VAVAKIWASQRTDRGAEDYREKKMKNKKQGQGKTCSMVARPQGPAAGHRTAAHTREGVLPENRLPVGEVPGVAVAKIWASQRTDRRAKTAV
jgi:hypothetical protein